MRRGQHSTLGVATSESDIRGRREAGARLAPEALFSALDGRRLSVSQQNWLVEVYSVYDDAESRWVQLALQGPPQHTVTVRMALNDSVDHIVDAVEAWLSHPSPTHKVLDVA
jgi:hypothetical protein